MAAARALLEKLVENRQILTAQDEEYGRTYSFVEDTVPPYLWLLSVDGRSVEGREVPARRVVG